MVQFNLLPDVKLEFVKAHRLKHMVIVISLIAGSAALVLFMITFLWVNVAQKKNIHDLNNDIKKYSTELRNVKDLDKILTVQNQLRTLPDLHEKKPIASRLFDYLAQVTPSQAGLSHVMVDFEASTINITGNTPNLDTVKTYTDTLKATKYSQDGVDEEKAFKDVVMSSFSRDDRGASFTINATFDPLIFDGTQKVALVVPSGISTNQSNLFQVGK
jgi:Tfp pilus assembly protein PilN